MEQEMDEIKSPASSRNNTQSMVTDDEGTITTRNSTQQSYMDEDMYENSVKSPSNTQRTEEMNDDGDLENHKDKQEERSSPHPKKRKRNTKKKEEDRSEDKQATDHKSKQRAPRKKSTPTTKSNNKTPTQVKRKGWSLEDDKKLVDAVLANLQDVPWSKIARENFSNRDRSSCYSRWNVMKKRLYQATGGDGNKSD